MKYVLYAFMLLLLLGGCNIAGKDDLFNPNTGSADSINLNKPTYVFKLSDLPPSLQELVVTFDLHLGTVTQTATATDGGGGGLGNRPTPTVAAPTSQPATQTSEPPSQPPGEPTP